MTRVFSAMAVLGRSMVAVTRDFSTLRLYTRLFIGRRLGDFVPSPAETTHTTEISDNSRRFSVEKLGGGELGRANCKAHKSCWFGAAGAKWKTSRILDNALAKLWYQALKQTGSRSVAVIGATGLSGMSLELRPPNQPNPDATLSYSSSTRRNSTTIWFVFDSRRSCVCARAQ